MMRKVTRIVLLALLLQITNASQFLISAQTPPKPARSSAVTAAQFTALKQFDDFVAQQMKFDKTPGLTIGFIKDGAVWVKGYGFADLENKVPAKPDSAYRLA
jgi:CubicO group peptidase (beta-lactamase class C family)